jgi:hypothetical protein
MKKWVELEEDEEQGENERKKREEQEGNEEQGENERK